MTDTTTPEYTTKINAFVKLLQKKEDLQEKVGTLFPSLRPELFTYKANPNCSCKAKILSTLKENAKTFGLIECTQTNTLPSIDNDYIYVPNRENSYITHKIIRSRDKNLKKLIGFDYENYQFSLFYIIDNIDNIIINETNSNEINENNEIETTDFT